MNTSSYTQKGTDNPERVDTFISDMISHLEADRFMFQAGAVEDSTRKTYDILCSNNHDEISNFGRIVSSSHFIKRVILDFMEALRESKNIPEKIAFSVSNSRVSAWVEIKEDDEATEDFIYLIEARLNAFYEKYNFGILVTIVESTDMIPIPARYKRLPNNIFK